MVRGLAALVVCVGHLRGFFFVDYPQTSGGFTTMIFYTLTGLHHQAVMVFFVLSGFLVGGSVLKGHRAGTWRWGGYLLRRLCRLWIVIVPALCLTLMWDAIGAGINPGAYAGAFYGEVLSGPTTGYDLSPLAFLGNVGFLQTIAVATYGSNGPVWSLANEFWYYLMFPLLLQAVLATTRTVARCIAIVLLAVLSIWLPPEMLLYGVIWLFGVVVFIVLENAAATRVVATWPFGLAAGLALAAALLADRAKLLWGADFVIGAAFALTLPYLTRAGGGPRWYGRIAFGLSEISYTLYLVHFPLLAFLFFTLLAPTQLFLTPRSFGLVVLILAGIIAYSAVIWWVFERNTDRVRATLTRWWGERKGRPSHV